MNELLVALSDLTGVAQDWAWGAFLVFLRVGAVMALVPAFGEQSVPQRVRLVLALAFTAAVLPALNLDPGRLPEPGLGPFGAEVAIGLALGFGLRLFVMGLQMAGAIAAQATSLAQVFGGASPDPQPAIGNLLTTAGLALAVASGLHVKLVTSLILSYQALPIGQLPGPSDVADWGLVGIIRAFALAFTLAAPFVLAALLYNVALGIINRAMPQLMVSFVGAPALTAGGLILMAIILPALLLVWSTQFDAFLAMPFRSLP